MPDRSRSFRIRIIDIILLTVAAALLLGPWAEMDRADSRSDRNLAIGLFFNAILTTVFVSASILARAAGHRRHEEWLTWAFVGLLANQGIATALPVVAVALMPVGVVVAGGLMFYVLGQLDV